MHLLFGNFSKNRETTPLSIAIPVPRSKDSKIDPNEVKRFRCVDFKEKISSSYSSSFFDCKSKQSDFISESSLISIFK